MAAVSKLQFVAGPEVAELENLLAQPYRAVGLPYLGLDDVRKRENRGKFISLVAVVQCVLPEVVVGSRKIIVVRLLDDDAPTSVLKLWEPEQRRVAATWLPRETVLLLSNVLVELDQYWGVQVLAGSSRSVITTDPDMWEARHLRHHAPTAAFAPLDRLATFVSCSTFLFDTFQQMTVAELRDLGDRGARTEAEALLTVSVLGTVTSTTLLSKDAVVTVCNGCGEPWTNLGIVDGSNIFDCSNFDCKLGTGSTLKYNITASFKDKTGELTNLEMKYDFLQPLLGDPETWAGAPTATRTTAAHLFLIGMVQFFLAVELPPTGQGRPLRIVIVSAN